ncbi:hypothetical protein HUT11_17040 [Streptomyces seoulensis]|nr:hypothetical protein HUT11_17040 [Streptomyces seoulensis]
MNKRPVVSALGALEELRDDRELGETPGVGVENSGVSGAARELRPWRREPVVAEVHDRLFGLMTAA